MKMIVHLCTQEDWSAALEKGSYRAASLDTEGFIHCSRTEQILEVANRYYPGLKGLILLWIDSEKLASELRYEDSGGGIFPHLYGPLNLEAVFSVTEFLPDSDGVFRNLPSPN